MKLNFHGLSGVVIIVAMLAVAYSKNRGVPWGYCVAAIDIYVIAIVILTRRYERRVAESRNPHLMIYQRLRAQRFANNQRIWMFGWHCAMALLTAGLWLVLQKLDRNVLVIFLTSIFGGLVIPRLLSEQNHLHWLGIVSLSAMVGVATLKNWDIPWVYFAITVLLYSISVLGLLAIVAAENELGFTGSRLVSGLHFALLFWAGGLLIHIDNIALQKRVGPPIIYTGIIFLGLAAGLAVPFLLFSAPVKISEPELISEQRRKRRR
jgi:hypothetical protein